MACRRALRNALGPLTLLVVAVAIALPAAAATVNGTLTITPELGRAAEERVKGRSGPLKQYFWRVPNGAIATADLPVVPTRDLAVVIEPAGGEASAPAGETVVVKLSGAGLDPSVVAITPRTKVRFRNEDPFVYHLACETNQAMSGSAPLAPGRGVEFPFDEPGIYEITDRRMPHVVGHVVVVGTRLVANPTKAESGTGAAFSFEEVQPGSYRVKVFHAGEWVADQELEVPEEQDEVGVTIRLPAESQQHEQAESADAEAEEGAE